MTVPHRELSVAIAKVEHMFDRLVELEAAAVACGRAAVDAAVGASGEAGPSSGVAGGAVESLEKAARAVSAAQLAGIAVFDSAQRAADTSARLGRRLTGRTVGTEVALTLGVSSTAGSGRVLFACSLVHEHPALLRLLGDGLVSEWHLRVVVPRPRN